MPMQQVIEHTPKLELAPSARLMVRFGWDTNLASDEMAGEMVGCVHYEFLVLRFYPKPGLLARLLPGAQARVRFMHEGVASECTLSVISHITRPALLVFLTYPRILSTLNIRQFKRIQSALPALLLYNETSLRGSVSDVSQGGCQLVIDARGQAAARSLQGGETATLQLCLDADGTTSSAPCTLRNIETEQFHAFAGLAFNNPSPDFQQRLTDYLEMVRHSL